MSWDIFVNGNQYSVGAVDLGFDHTTSAHTFGFVYSSGSINFYANGKFLASTTAYVPSANLAPQATFEAHPSWWGTLSYTGPTNVYLGTTSYSPCNN